MLAPTHPVYFPGFEKLTLDFFPAGQSCSAEVLMFLDTHSDRRITAASRAYYAGPDAPGVLVTYRIGEGLLALSGCRMNNALVSLSVTAVHRDFRRAGIGTWLLACKLDALERTGYTFATVIADDNLASKRVCEKAGLTVFRSDIRERASGQYLAHTYTRSTP